MFITFEGIDGCGKSTLAKALYEKLSILSMKVILTKEPGATKEGEHIRDILLYQDNFLDPFTEFLLFASDRRAHAEKVIVPALQQGYIVISDRYADSSVAYQGYGRGVPISFIDYVHKNILNKAIPDLTFLIDLPVSLSLSRLINRDRIEKYGEEFFARVREGYLDIAGKNKKRFVIIDGSKTINDLSNEVFSITMGAIEKNEHTERSNF